MSDPQPAAGAPPRAVFLSYARDDADAARRIADALRAFGVEVWFDQNELRGGDAWDAKIKKQIRDCALFVAVISATTQARGEGYFRREWKLAVERTHDMSASRAFLVPVVIDDTAEAHAEVPEEFMRVQWTRLAHGVPTPDFVAQMKRLLDLPPRNSEAGRPHPAQHGAGAATPTRRVGPGWIWAVVAALAFLLAGGGAYLVLHKPVTVRAAGTPAAASATAPNPAATVNDKSIAVLPFENMSEEKDSAFFSDGIQEDILTNLANVADLRVVSRTSVMEYRNTTKNIRQIAQELGVAFVLEGSVRRAGNKVKVTGQLIDARTDTHLWAKNYDRDLTDIFAIQSELATEIVHSLQAVLSPQEKSRLERAPTDNVHAYELLLQARALLDRTGQVLGFDANRRNYDQVVSLLEQAVELDPTFVKAWTTLAWANGSMYFHDVDRAPSRLARMREAIDSAARAAPDDPEVVLAEGEFYFFGFRDWARARAQYERVIAQAPGNLRARSLLATVSWYEGRWVESVAERRKVLAGDPRDGNALRSLAFDLAGLRRYDEAIAIDRTNEEIRPGDQDLAFARAELAFHATGSRQELDEAFTRLPANQQSDDGILRRRFRAAWVCGDAPGLIHWSEALGGAAKLDDQRKLQLGAALLATGETDGARTLWRENRILQEGIAAHEPENWGLWLRLAETCAYLGDASAAEATLAKAAAFRPREREAFDSAFTSLERAIVLAWTGRKEDAVRELAQVLRAPCPGYFGYTPSIPHLRVGLEWAPLRDRPDFQALLADPKNNEPLF